MTDPVTAAITATEYNAWVTTTGGDRIPQSSSPRVIESMLRLLDPQPGHRVMEIGTGTGYTAALLAHIVGPNGRVVSLDVDPQLAKRAAALHRNAGHDVIETHATDGFAGWSTTAPYDRIVGWTTPHVLPHAWVTQTVTGGVIVTPVKIAPVAAANAIIRCAVEDGAPRDGNLQPGSFIDMANEIVTDFGTPVRYVDAIDDSPGDNLPPGWISAARLHDQPKHLVERLLHRLQAAEPQPRPADADDEAFTAFLLATTVNAASANTLHGRGLGVATLDSIAVLVDGAVLNAGSGQAHDELISIHTQWVELDKPGYRDITATFNRVADGWHVRPNYRRTVGHQPVHENSPL